MTDSNKKESSLNHEAIFSMNAEKNGFGGNVSGYLDALKKFTEGFAELVSLKLDEEKKEKGG